MQGLDATAARSFVTLHNKLHRMGIQASTRQCPGCASLVPHCSIHLGAPGRSVWGIVTLKLSLAMHTLLQLIITHIPARRGNVRRLLAAQGLILRQPTAIDDLQDDAGGGWGWKQVLPGLSNECCLQMQLAMKSHDSG